MLQWNENTQSALGNMKNSFPHLLFYGVNESVLYNAVNTFMELIKRNWTDKDVLTHECEINGGISAIREVLRPFTRGPRHARPTIVLLRRFDRLSHDAQFAPRRTMEIDQDKCRCIAVSTTLSTIIQPILSRFVVIESNPTQHSCYSQTCNFSLIHSSSDNEKLTEKLKGISLCEAHKLARGGLSMCDVVVCLDGLGRSGALPWRVVAAGYELSTKNCEEAVGLFLFGQVLEQWDCNSTLFNYCVA